MSEVFKNGGWIHFAEDGEYLAHAKNIAEFAASIESIVEDIRQIVEAAEKLAFVGQPPIDRPKNVLKRLVFQLADYCFLKGWENTLQDEMERLVRANGGHLLPSEEREEVESLIFLCFRGVDISGAWVRSGERTRLSRQLSHALREGVPHGYLIGYIHQEGKYITGFKETTSKQSSKEGAAVDDSDDDDWDFSLDETHDLEAQPDSDLKEDDFNDEYNWEE